jgi:hypothetical protein
VQLFYGNKTGSSLEDFTAVLGDTPALRAQSQDPPTPVLAGQQAKHVIMVEAMR